MRVTLLKVSSGLLLPLLAAVVFVTASGTAYSQSNTRSFQMALWSDPNRDGNGDIPTFFFGQLQPAQGPTVLVGYNPNYDYSAGNPPGAPIDWSRVVAVEVDEPYGLGSLDKDMRYPDGSPACGADLSADIPPMDALLQSRAAQLKVLAPKARFWVNLTAEEADWIGFCGTPQVLNRTYIDVISADWYFVDYTTIQNSSSLQAFYTVVAANRPKPDQQLAMIPGTFYRSGQDDPATQASHFQTYFPYANAMNQSCNLPLGDRGVTGHFDGCLLWMVLGWQAPNFTQNNTTYVGLLDSTSTKIKTAWDNELLLPLAPAVAHQLTPAQLMQPIQQLLLPPRYSIGGTVSGLVGSGLVIGDPSAGAVTVSANGNFVLPNALQVGANYSVSIETPPANPTQACAVNNGSGTVGTANVQTVTVTCH